MSDFLIPLSNSGTGIRNQTKPSEASLHLILLTTELRIRVTQNDRGLTTSCPKGMLGGFGLRKESIMDNAKEGNSDFPHQTTADQFFDDAQFEAYRALGEHIADQAVSKTGTLRINCDGTADCNEV